ncbi:hypothetical protein ACFPRL_24535 [Pseudoclavibacter helvolus]
MQVCGAEPRCRPADGPERLALPLDDGHFDALEHALAHAPRVEQESAGGEALDAAFGEGHASGIDLLAAHVGEVLQLVDAGRRELHGPGLVQLRQERRLDPRLGTAGPVASPSTCCCQCVAFRRCWGSVAWSHPQAAGRE